jgi:hypothetical protein
MTVYKNINAGTAYAENAWLKIIEKLAEEVENSPEKRVILETSLVPLGTGINDDTGDIFALIRGPEQGLGRIFTNSIDENSTRLVVKLLQNCHFVNIQVQNRRSNLKERIDLLIGQNTPWEVAKNAIENYIKTMAGFEEDGIKTFGFISANGITNFDLVRT